MFKMRESFDFKKEVKRKSIHLLAVVFVIIFILVSENYGEKLALLSLVFFLIIFLEVDYVRVELGRKIPIIWRLFRRKEQNRHGGQVFFLVGAIIAFSVFSFDIALAAVLMTVFGDTTAALIGKRFGKFWITKNRSIEGIAAEFIADLIIAAIILDGLVLILIMSITATIVEAAVDKLDDNLMIPLFAGFAGEVVELILNVV